MHPAQLPIEPHELEDLPNDMRIARLASLQHGLVARSQLDRLGVRRSAIARRVARGSLIPVHPRVWAVGHDALSFTSRVHAAVLTIGAGAVASARSAVYLHGVDLMTARTVEVLAPRRHRHLQGVVVHSSRVLTARDTAAAQGVPVTRPARTIVDLADVLEETPLVRMIHEFRVRKLITVRELRDQARRHRHRRGHPSLVRAIERHLAGDRGSVRSNELRFRQLLQARGVPDPLMNVLVVTPGGRYVVDFVWPGLRYCVELDDGTHDLPYARRTDRVRSTDLVAAGYRLLRVPIEWMEEGADRVASDLLASARD